MAVRIEHSMVVEDVRSGHKTFEEVFKADLFSLGKVSGRHYVGVCYVLENTWQREVDGVVVARSGSVAAR